MAASKRKLKPPRDKDGKFRRRCDELADELGFHRSEIWELWSQMSLMIEYELRSPRPYAERMAYQHILAIYTKELGMQEAN